MQQHFHGNEFSWSYTARAVGIGDFSGFILFPGCSALLHPCSRRESSRISSSHPPEPNSLPRAGWGLAPGFLGFISAVPGRRSCPGFPQGWSWEPWKMQGWGREARKKKKSANEMNQLLQGRQPELSPILLFPRRKAGKGGGRISFPEHSAG